MSVQDTVQNGKGSKPRMTKKYAQNYDDINWHKTVIEQPLLEKLDLETTNSDLPQIKYGHDKEDDSFEAWKLKYPQGNFFDYCCDMEAKYGFPTIGHAEFFDPKQFPNISTPEKAFEAGQKAAENLKKFIP